MEKSLFARCYRPKSPPIGPMIKEGRTSAGKLIVRDLEKAYSDFLVACSTPMDFLHFPRRDYEQPTKCSPHVKYCEHAV